MNYQPLREILADTVDFDLLRKAHCPLNLFLSATNVRTGKLRVFNNDEIGPDAVLASACLPTLFQAVQIDGEHYWDGGYLGNPAIFPLIYNCDSRDVVIVHVNPIERRDVPTTAMEIMNRINEISSNSSLMREMRAIDFVTKLIDNGDKHGKNLKRMLIHAIAAEAEMVPFGIASKLNADWQFLTKLRDIGREKTSAWLDDNFDHLNAKSTVDIQSKYL